MDELLNSADLFREMYVKTYLIVNKPHTHSPYMFCQSIFFIYKVNFKYVIPN